MKISTTRQDWEEPLLRAAAVEFVFNQLGARPRAEGELRAWREGLAGMAVKLEGVDVRELELWMGDEKLRPEGAKGKAPARQEDDESVIARMADPGELLAGLIGEDEVEVSALERDALAAAVARGEALSEDQREIVAGLLRGSGTAARAEVLRRLVEFIVPAESNGARVRVWEKRDKAMAVPVGCRVDRVESGVVIPGWKQVGAQHLVVYDAQGKVWGVRMLAMVHRIEQRSASSLLLKYRQLVPVGVFASEVVCRKLALVESLLHPERSCEGKRLARMLDVSEPAVHYGRKGLVEKINAATGGRAGIKGMRNKDQKNKGGSRKMEKGSRGGAETEGRAA